LDLVKRIERCGSRSGTPTQKVTITDCGILSSDGDAAVAAAAPKLAGVNDGLFGKNLSKDKEDFILAQPPKPWYQLW